MTLEGGFDGDRDEDLEVFRFSLDMMLSDRFFEEDFEKRLGRTIR